MQKLGTLDFEICKLRFNVTHYQYPCQCPEHKNRFRMAISDRARSISFSGGSNFGVSPNRDLLEANLYEYV